MDMRAVRGLAEANARMDFLPQAAREQLGVEVAIVANDILAAQRRDVAFDTGELRGKLTVEAQIEQLRARVGLIGVKARSKSAVGAAKKGKRAVGRSYGKAFHGRFVEYGRRAQTVTVERRKRVDGRLRSSRGRKIASDVVKSYTMRVPAQAARPFVHKDRPEHKFDRRIASFWAGLMAKSGS